MNNIVLLTARSWIGTNFHHMGRSKKKSITNLGGCDCLGLIMGMSKEINIKSKILDKDGNNIPLHKYDVTGYSRTPNGKHIYNKLKNIINEIDIYNMKIGDLLLLKMRNNPQHLAILSNYKEKYGIIHTWQDVGKVVEHELTDYWYKKIHSVFRFTL